MICEVLDVYAYLSHPLPETPGKVFFWTKVQTQHAERVLFCDILQLIKGKIYTGSCGRPGWRARIRPTNSQSQILYGESRNRR